MPAASSARNRDGYATVSALVLSLAIALVAAGSLAVAGAELQAARRDYDRMQASADLESVLLLATYQVVTTPGANRLGWIEGWNGSSYDVIAEAESAKLDLEVAPEAIPDEVFERLGVSPDTAREVLRSVPASDRRGLVEAFPSPAWRSCILSLVSPAGGTRYALADSPSTPERGDPDWRTGQVWRFRASAPDGWTDDRLVRWSGDGRDPVFVIDRQLYRSDGVQTECDVALR